MYLSQIAAVLTLAKPAKDIAIQQISIDTRCLSQGDLYVALSGEQFDGHDFISQAVQAGAVAVLVDHPVSANIPQLIVKNTRQALAALATWHRQQMDPCTIAVTGSCGKTTTRGLLKQVFARQGQTHASVKSFNNEVGVPLTLLGLQSEDQFLIAEIGTNHPGEIAALTRIVSPDIAIITNVSSTHLEFFGDEAGVAKEKTAIFTHMAIAGTAIVNRDDHFAEDWLKLLSDRRVVTFAINQPADVMATKITYNDQAQPSFQLVTPQGDISIQLQLMGEHNIRNGLAAAAAGYAAGISLEKIQQGLQATLAEDKRLVEKPGLSGACIIDDSYNANPLAVKAAVAVLQHRPGKAILVLGDMGELGEHASQVHAELGEAVRASGVDQLYCVGELAQHAAKAFGKQGFAFANKADLLVALKPQLQPNTTVLVKGARSMKMEEITAAILDS